MVALAAVAAVAGSHLTTNSATSMGLPLHMAAIAAPRSTWLVLAPYSVPRFQPRTALWQATSSRWAAKVIGVKPSSGFNEKIRAVISLEAVPMYRLSSDHVIARMSS